MVMNLSPKLPFAERRLAAERDAKNDCCNSQALGSLRQCMAVGDVATETAERFRKRTFDDIDATRGAVALSDAAAKGIVPTRIGTLEGVGP
jgi:hypothetical protein